MTDSEKPRNSHVSLSIHPSAHAEPGKRVSVALAALGVVFGDLGTSPLYTMQECLSGPHGLEPTEANVMGVLSLVFWSLTVVITIKYLVFLMRADNGGEGGIMALLALAPERYRNPRPGRIGVVASLVIAGAALLFGDGIITPAVSVLAAIEGLGVATESLKSAIVPITVAILVAIFAVQRHGTGKLGRFFGPIMLVWFVTLAVLGAYHVAMHPGILRALSPLYAAGYFAEHGFAGIAILGGVVLCVTGGEALYADMGHFGPGPIRQAWLYVCVPSLVLAYFGQGAVILSQPDRALRLQVAARPFYAMCPQGVWLYPFVVIAALATIIASQALISGVFSLTYQAVQLGFFPRVSVQHTSQQTEGQIYLPLINWGLSISCVALVLLFGESSKLAAAYGLAVSGTMTITSIVYYFVARHTWKWPLWKAGGITAFFLMFDLPFLAANVLKFFIGGYIPVLVGALFVAVMVNWRIGRGLLGLQVRRNAKPLDTFIGTLEEKVDIRTRGTAVYMASGDGVPAAMRRVTARFRALHENVILLTVVLEHTPRVAPEARVQNIADLGKGFHRITLHYGFIEEADIPYDLSAELPAMGIECERKELLYVVGRETIVATSRGRLGPIVEGFFAFLTRNAKSATDYFRLPPEQVVEVGAQIDL